MSFSQCHFDNWDMHPTTNRQTPYIRKGTPAISQLGGTLLLNGNEFTGHMPKPNHLNVGTNATKTIVTSNIIEGVLKIEQQNEGTPKTKLIIANNADDS